MSIEEQLRSIHEALNKIGASFMQDDYSIPEELIELRSSEPPPILQSESFEFEESSIYDHSNPNELQTLLDEERKRCEDLESQVKRKDKLIDEMGALQNELCANIEELQNKLELQQGDIYRVLPQEIHAKELELANEKLKLGEKITDLNFKLEQSYLKQKTYLEQIRDLKLKLEFKRRSENLEIVNAKKQISSQNVEILRLKKEKEEYKCNANDMIALKNEILHLKEDADNLKKLIEEHKSINLEFQKNYEKAKKKFMEYEKIIESMQEEIYSLQKEINCSQTINEFCDEIDINEISWSGSEINSDLNYSDTKSLCSCARKKQIIEFYQHLENVIIQFMPEGTSLESLTPKQIWNWLIIIVEEHTELKKSLNGQFIEKIFRILNVKSQKSAIKVIENFVKKI